MERKIDKKSEDINVGLQFYNLLRVIWLKGLK